MICTAIMLLIWHSNVQHFLTLHFHIGATSFLGIGYEHILEKTITYLHTHTHTQLQIGAMYTY